MASNTKIETLIKIANTKKLIQLKKCDLRVTIYLNSLPNHPFLS